MPKVSVVVPIYGVEKYIERCVRSLFSQTLDDIEFVFIDDCTIDNSMLILENLIIEFEEHIDNMHWSIVRYKMPRNSGLPSVRKRGIELATGDYILHCDSDDWMDSNMVSDMWNLANDRNLDVVICGFADVETAYPSYNMRLSKRRVTSVFRMLVDKYGVDPNHLSIDYMGDTVQPYDRKNEWNRVVVFVLQPHEEIITN